MKAWFDKRADALIVVGIISFVICFSVFMTVMTGKKADSRLAKAEERCAEYANGADFILDEDRQWGTDDWVCTFTNGSGEIEQIRWPES